MLRNDNRHNFSVNILDGTFFGFALGFASFTTILPLFVSTMTGSAVLIGLVPAIHNMGWLLPQVFTARWISRLPVLKRFVIFFSLSERVPFLAFAAVAGLLPLMGTKTALILTFAILTFQGFGGGITANAWINLMGKVIPPNRLATFFGFQAAGANFLASLGAIIAGYILDLVPGNNGFTLCFISAGLLMGISWVFLALTRENRREILPESGIPISILTGIAGILRGNKNFTWFLVARNLSQFGLMALAFYSVYIVNIFHVSPSIVGMYTGVLMITQMVTNPVLGFISDRWGKKWVMVFGSLCSFAAPLLAVISQGIGVFFLVFILTGIANTTFWIVGMTLSLDFGSEEERPLYVGISNTFVAPSSVLAPIIGGWLADLAGYPATFIFAGLVGLATTAIYVILLKEPK